MPAPGAGDAEAGSGPSKLNEFPVAPPLCRVRLPGHASVQTLLLPSAPEWYEA
jgi:hypothetical protein